MVEGQYVVLRLDAPPLTQAEDLVGVVAVLADAGEVAGLVPVALLVFL